MILAQEQQLVPVGSLLLHPDNVRQGDVGAISVSLQAHGQYRPIVVQQSTGYVLAGNHTLKAATTLGWTEIAVTYVDVTDDEARRILLVDNRSNDLASYDDQGLSDFLTELIESPLGLTGTGYEPEDLDDMIAALGPSDGDERYTPEWIFEAMAVEFDIDLAAPTGGVSYIPAQRYFTKEDDALEQDWSSLTAWCNPPFSVAEAFARKWVEEGVQGCWLGPMSNNTTYVTDLWDRAYCIWSPSRNIEFTYRGEPVPISWKVFVAGFGAEYGSAVERLASVEHSVLLKPLRRKPHG